MKGGRVVGESDSHGAFPKSSPKTPQDVLATLHAPLGVDPRTRYVNAVGLPINVLSEGSPSTELF